MYKALAPLYDILFEDYEASKTWAKLVEENSIGKKVLELACGSGDIANFLYQKGYEVLATDISQEMLEVAKRKYPSGIQFQLMDMLELNVKEKFDEILCFCDSLNYILKEEQLLYHFQQVYKTLRDGGTYIFDIHSLDRKVEFEETYIETGVVEGINYQWEIFCEDEYLLQQFVFYYDEGIQTESHVQVIWDPNWIQRQLEKIGFSVKMTTDFTKEGIQEGEKYFFVAKKEG